MTLAGSHKIIRVLVVPYFYAPKLTLDFNQKKGLCSNPIYTKCTNEETLI